LVSDADDRAIGIALQVRVGGELVDQLKSPAAVDRGNGNVNPNWTHCDGAVSQSPRWTTEVYCQASLGN
jgi:hypothetical protein